MKMIVGYKRMIQAPVATTTVITADKAPVRVQCSVVSLRAVMKETRHLFSKIKAGQPRRSRKGRRFSKKMNQLMKESKLCKRTLKVKSSTEGESQKGSRLKKSV